MIVRRVVVALVLAVACAACVRQVVLDPDAGDGRPDGAGSAVLDGGLPDTPGDGQPSD